MGRFPEYDGDGDPLAEGRWIARVNSAFNGKRGQRILRELEAMLLAMPEKRLIAGELTTPDGECCTVGLYCAAKQAEANGTDVKTEARALAENPVPEEDQWDDYDATEDTVAAGVAAGMTETMAWELGSWNDCYDWYFDKQTRERRDYTPEERYEKMLSFVRKKLRPAAAGMGE